MVNHSWAKQDQVQTPLQSQFHRDIFAAQEKLYSYLLDLVKTWAATDVVQEFKQIFIQPTNSTSSEILPALYQILLSNQEQEFRNTLKRSCYILINNWELMRNYQAIQQLVQVFADPVLQKPTVSPTLRRLRRWLQDFVVSSDFHELKLFTERYEERRVGPWSHRYASYLLVPQYINLNNSFEQRQAAKLLYSQLREKFKYDLAMYTAYQDPATTKQTKFRNPTFLGDEVLQLIQKIIAKRGFFSYPNLARIFLKQTQGLNYEQFKCSLLKYLSFSNEQNEVSQVLSQHLSDKLNSLYLDRQHQVLDEALLLRTTNRVIDHLTTEDRQTPSFLFVLLLSKGNALTIVIILLKLVLICRYSRVHLESRIADLIKYYEQFSEEECKWMIHFLEVFNLAMTIHADNVEYSLVSMTTFKENPASSSSGTYRIFSQMKQSQFAASEPDLLELSALESLASPSEAAQ